VRFADEGGGAGSAGRPRTWNTVFRIGGLLSKYDYHRLTY